MSSPASTCGILRIIEPFHLFPGNSVPIDWSIVEGDSVENPPEIPVTDATGTLTIYDPYDVPVPGANALPMVQTPPLSGTYRAMIDGTQFNPPVGVGYRTVISLTSITSGVGLWTIRTEIDERETP